MKKLQQITLGLLETTAFYVNIIRMKYRHKDRVFSLHAF